MLGVCDRVARILNLDEPRWGHVHVLALGQPAARRAMRQCGWHSGGSLRRRRALCCAMGDALVGTKPRCPTSLGAMAASWQHLGIEKCLVQA